MYFRTARTDVFYDLLFVARPIIRQGAEKYGIPFKDVRYYSFSSLVDGKPERFSPDFTYAFIDGRYLFQDKQFHYQAFRTLGHAFNEVSQDLPGDGPLPRHPWYLEEGCLHANVGIQSTC